MTSTRSQYGTRFNTAPTEFNPKTDLPAGFMEFLLPLHRELTPRQQTLRQKRAGILASSHQGNKPNYLPASVATTTDWTIPLPDWCADQRNQMTGPADDAELLEPVDRTAGIAGEDLDEAHVGAVVGALEDVGRVLLEESKANECQGKQPPAFKEMFISAWHKDSDAARNQPQFIWSIGTPVNPDAQGNFTIRNLASSQYYFVARFPVRSWFLKSIAMSPPAGARAGKPSDVTRVWTNVKTGDRLSGLIVTPTRQSGSSTA